MQKRPPKPRPDPKRLCDLAHMADEPQSTDVLGSYTGTARTAGIPCRTPTTCRRKRPAALKTRRALS